MTRLALALLVVSLGGCSSAMDLGGNPDAGHAHDGSVVTHPRTDECGNGVDDDGNGRIDDGCPCGPGETQSCYGGALSERGVGTCTSGTQTCVTTTGDEWGDWGDSTCDGDVLPMSDTCDGLDADCDGAIDEQCPCTAGQTRACGQEFVRMPCSAGTQTCRASGWSTCEGAIGPTADVCGDDIDNDCDGTIDDGCDCVPVPEICGDGIDNDCDGQIDEPACTHAPDAGTDAGTDANRPDAGPSSCVDGTSCLGTPGALSSFGPVVSLSGYGSPIHLASDGSRLFAATTDMEGATSALQVEELAADGTPLWQTMIAANVSANDVRLLWTGSTLIVAHTDQSTSSLVSVSLTTVDPTTHAATPLATVDTMQPLLGGFGIHDGELAVAWVTSFSTSASSSGNGRFRRYALDGTASGNAVDLGPNIQPRSVAHVGDAWLVGARDAASFTSLYFVIRNDTVSARVALERPAMPCSWPTGGVIAASCDGALVCWRDYATTSCGIDATVAERCQRIDATGALVGSSTLLFTPLRYGPAGYAVWDDLIYTGSEYLLHTENARQGDVTTTPRTDTLIRIGLDGTVRDIHAEASLTLGYEYGDIVRQQDCIVEMIMGSSASGAFGNSQPRVRRTCDSTCH